MNDGFAIKFVELCVFPRVVLFHLVMERLCSSLVEFGFRLFILGLLLVSCRLN